MSLSHSSYNTNEFHSQNDFQVPLSKEDMEWFPTNKKHSQRCRVNVLGTGPQLAASTYSRNAGL